MPCGVVWCEQHDGECDDVCNTQTNNWDKGDCPTPTARMHATQQADSVAHGRTTGRAGVANPFEFFRPSSPTGRQVPQNTNPRLARPRSGTRSGTRTGGSAGGAHGTGG